MNNKVRKAAVVAMLLCSAVLISFGAFGDSVNKNNSITATYSPTQAFYRTKRSTEIFEASAAVGVIGSGEMKAAYVLNSGSKVFHHPWCGHADDIDEENREIFSGTKDEILQKGYRPCGKCKP